MSDDQSVKVPQAMLTTRDNPYDPFKQWRDWYAFDVKSGHNTTSLVGRLLTTTDVHGGNLDQALINLELAAIADDPAFSDTLVVVYGPPVEDL